MQYWHEVMTDDKYKELVDNNTKIEEVLNTYKQPEWCTYLEALAGEMGCWSLMGRKVKDKSSCVKCDCYKLVGN